MKRTEDRTTTTKLKMIESDLIKDECLKMRWIKRFRTVETKNFEENLLHCRSS
jgi:uncharacterized protein YodC (DUF2158 family)